MGSIHTIFEMNDPDDYSILEQAGYLLESEIREIHGIKGDLRYFSSKARGNMFRRFFVSKNFEVNIGVMDKGDQGINTGEVYGPSYVFGLASNTQDSGQRGYFEEQLNRAFDALSSTLGNFRERLSYAGTFRITFRLLYPDINRETLENLVGPNQ